MASRFLVNAVVLSAVTMLGGCAGRPTAEVLNPVPLTAEKQKNINILAATNRKPEMNGVGYETEWAGKLTFQSYTVSVPPVRKGTTIAYATDKPQPQRQYIVTDRQELSRKSFVRTATQAMGPDGVAGIFVHGYNYTYQEALFRIAQMGADSGAPGTPILFSWPSAAVVAGYVADRDAALASRSELDSLVESLSAASKVRRIVLLGHSMGSFLVMEAVRQLKLQGKDDALRKVMVVLAAPDIDLDVFKAQLHDIGEMTTPITVLVSKSDRALSVSSFIGGERARVGAIDIDDAGVRDALVKEGVRLIDITSVKGSDGLGHDRYAALARFGTKFAAVDTQAKSSIGSVGAFIFDAGGAIAASPFRLAGKALRSP